MSCVTIASSVRWCDVSHFDITRRSDALFRDHAKRRDLCDMIALRERDLEELRSKLRVIRSAVHAGRPIELFGYIYVRRQDGDEG